MTSRFIVTATPELQGSALGELREVAADARRVRSFSDGVCLVETEMPAHDFTEAMIRTDPIFVKHMMPVQSEVALAGDGATDLPAMWEVVRDVCGVSAGEELSVQCRRVGADHDYTAKDVEVFIGSRFEAGGAVPRFSDLETRLDDAQKIVSIYLYRDEAYAGCSTARDNLNQHCDEHRVSSRCAREISRAEFRLMEAIRKFGLDIPQGRALDLGAAPGGWTKVLADAGMQVVAIDPAELDERVARLPTVTHVRSKAEDCECGGDFDLLVNDMNIDPEESAETMVRMDPHLKPGAFAIMAVKFVIRKPRKLLGNIMPTLAEEYDLLRVKSLFHNRREVTMLLERRVDASADVRWARRSPGESIELRLQVGGGDQCQRDPLWTNWISAWASGPGCIGCSTSMAQATEQLSSCPSTRAWSTAPLISFRTRRVPIRTTSAGWPGRGATQASSSTLGWPAST